MIPNDTHLILDISHCFVNAYIGLIDIAIKISHSLLFEGFFNAIICSKIPGVLVYYYFENLLSSVLIFDKISLDIFPILFLEHHFGRTYFKRVDIKNISVGPGR